MGIITLTDRISVSVRAKNETESNSQKRATGKNIANALGNGNISDELADQLGNTSKPTIADEQGREWVAMSDIIAAGKKMQQEGAFDEKEEHEGIGDYNLVNVHKGPASIESYWADSIEEAKLRIRYDIPSGVYFVAHRGAGWASGFLYLFSKERFTFKIYESSRNTVNDTWSEYSQSSQYESNSISATIDDIGYSAFVSGTSSGHLATSNHYIPDDSLLDYPYDQTPTYNNTIGYLFGPVRQSGGSLIDWTKPDDEIEEDIRNLHETWDVSDHAGSTTANGTYVLAGPIEFNPGD